LGDSLVRSEAHVVIMSAGQAGELQPSDILADTVADIETDTSPLAGVSIDLDGARPFSAFATRKAIDELKLRRGDRVVKDVALTTCRASSAPARFLL
jgi:hypothetical protein